MQRQITFDPAYARADYIPITNGTLNLGSAAFGFNNAYANNLRSATGSALSIRASSGNVSMYTSGLNRWEVNTSGQFTQDATNGSDIVLNVTGTGLRMGTSDGSDNKIMMLSGGGGSTASRGAVISLAGNEASGGGSVNISGGNVSSGHINLILNNASSLIQLYNASTALMWSCNNSGQLIQDSTNGGYLIMPRALNSAAGIMLGASSKPSDVAQAALWVVADVTTNVQAIFQQSTNDVNGNIIYFNKTRKTDNTADTIVASGDYIAKLFFQGADGASFRPAAQINVVVDGTPGSSDMPGRIELLTTADGGATPLERWRINSSGQLVQDGTNGGDFIFNVADGVIRQGTSDASDNKSITLAGGGGTSVTRGGRIAVYGNEYTAVGGSISVVGGGVSTGHITLQTQHSSANIDLQTNALSRWIVNGSGELSQNSSNGGNIVFTRSNMTVVDTVEISIAATGTTVTDAYQLSKKINVVSSGAAATGVKAWAATIGQEIVVMSINANTFKFYVPSGENIHSVGASINIATNDVKIFMKVDATNWIVK